MLRFLRFTAATLGVTVVLWLVFCALFEIALPVKPIAGRTVAYRFDSKDKVHFVSETEKQWLDVCQRLASGSIAVGAMIGALIWHQNKEV